MTEVFTRVEMFHAGAENGDGPKNQYFLNGNGRLVMLLITALKLYVFAQYSL